MVWQRGWFDHSKTCPGLLLLMAECSEQLGKLVELQINLHFHAKVSLSLEKVSLNFKVYILIDF